jgi:hypothetical protein
MLSQNGGYLLSQVRYQGPNGQPMTDAEAKKAKEQDQAIAKAINSTPGLRALIAEKCAGPEYDAELRRLAKAAANVWMKDQKYQKDTGIKIQKDLLVRAHATLPEAQHITQQHFLKVAVKTVEHMFYHAFVVNEETKLSNERISDACDDMIDRFKLMGNPVPPFELWGKFLEYGYCQMAHLLMELADLTAKGFTRHTVILLKEGIATQDYTHFVELDNEYDDWKVLKNYSTMQVEAYSEEAGDTIPLRKKFIKKYNEEAKISFRFGSLS